jgi:cytidylate kinase
MTAITISRQIGSLGGSVAREVAARLGYRIVTRQVINQAALQSGAPECALHAIDELGLLGIKPSSKARRAYHNAMRGVMKELADQGNVVIVGRAGQAILRNRPDVLHVRVVAPEQARAEHLATAHGIPPAAALEQVRAVDRARSQYVRRHFGVDADDPRMYDLIINTGRMTCEAAADLICNAVTRWSRIANESTRRWDLDLE